MRRQASLQYFTSAQLLAQCLRQLMARPQAAQGLLGSAALLPRNVAPLVDDARTPLGDFFVPMRYASAGAGAAAVAAPCNTDSIKACAECHAPSTPVPPRKSPHTPRPRAASHQHWCAGASPDVCGMA